MLDEPFSSLDAGIRATVRAEVVAVLRSTGTTALLVTHDQHEALSMADQVAVLLDGRVAQVADPATLYERPSSLAVACFVGDANVLVGRSDSHTVETAVGPVIANGAAPIGQVNVVVRPEQLILSEIGTGAAGTVTAITYFGHDALVEVDIGSGEVLHARLVAHRVPRTGDRVGIGVTGVVPVFPR